MTHQTHNIVTNEDEEDVFHENENNEQLGTLDELSREESSEVEEEPHHDEMTSVDPGDNRVIQHSPMSFEFDDSFSLRLNNSSGPVFNAQAFAVNHEETEGDLEYNYRCFLVNACYGEGNGSDYSKGVGCPPAGSLVDSNPSTKSGSINIATIREEQSRSQSLSNPSDQLKDIPDEVMSMSTSSSCMLVEPTEEERAFLFNLPPVSPDFMISKLTSQISIEAQGEPYLATFPYNYQVKGEVPLTEYESDAAESSLKVVDKWLIESVDKVYDKIYLPFLNISVLFLSAPETLSCSENEFNCFGSIMGNKFVLGNRIQQQTWGGSTSESV